MTKTYKYIAFIGYFFRCISKIFAFAWVIREVTCSSEPKRLFGSTRIQQLNYAQEKNLNGYLVPTFAKVGYEPTSKSQVQLKKNY